TTISDGTLIADHADSLGSGDIDNSGVLKVGEGELKNTLSGSGLLVKTGKKKKKKKTTKKKKKKKKKS
ncbi:AIDA autotransporter-like protein ShdA, partial [Salmonella enterica subsp. enterica serovar Newport str. SHSN007]|uniref:hypothetical protein n=1 Tax=Salmonella enterica TaxID=28901 RepID=UPI000A189900